MISLDVILITHNRMEYLPKTLGSLEKNLGMDHRLIIWDNNSNQDQKAYLTGYALNNPEFVQLILCDNNLGWGAAVNEAMMYSHSDYVLLINDDVEFDPGFIGKCFKAYRDNPAIGILGLWHHIAHSEIGKGEGIILKNDMPAVAWLLYRNHINEIGRFKENGPCKTKGGNGEDTDYCTRAIEKGFIVCGLETDVAHHMTGY